MHKLFYPAIFHIAEEGGFWISFPDFPECFSQGENMEESYEMAVEALGLCLTERQQNSEPIPSPSLPQSIELEDNAVLLIVEFDMEAYRRKHNSKAVKKTLSIPEWLNEEATALNINFSQVLQEALIQKLAK